MDELPETTLEGVAANEEIAGTGVDVPLLQAARVNAASPAIQIRGRRNFGEQGMLRTASVGLI